MSQMIGKILHKKRILAVVHWADFSDCQAAFEIKTITAAIGETLSTLGYPPTQVQIFETRSPDRGAIILGPAGSVFYQAWPDHRFFAVDLSLGIDDFPVKKFLAGLKDLLGARAMETRKAPRGPAILGA